MTTPTKSKNTLYDQLSKDDPLISKYIKIGGGVVVTIFGIYLLGHIFKISAHCINGVNQLKLALKNGK